jgi:hypothetical protein
MRKVVILADYDGTLCPTGSIKSQDDDSRIPEELEQVLWNISDKIPVCIISSKDFGFLHERTRFASIVSCILGIQTVVMKRHRRAAMSTTTKTIKTMDNNIAAENTGCSNNFNLNCIIDDRTLLDNETLRYNSRKLVGLVKAILPNFKHVEIEKKFTTTAGKRGTLAGITIDWRHVEDWSSFKKETEPLLKKAIRKELSVSSNTPSPLYIQTYNTHPFIDVY